MVCFLKIVLSIITNKACSFRLCHKANSSQTKRINVSVQCGFIEMDLERGFGFWQDPWQVAQPLDHRNCLQLAHSFLRWVTRDDLIAEKNIAPFFRLHGNQESSTSGSWDYPQTYVTSGVLWITTNFWFCSPKWNRSCCHGQQRIFRSLRYHYLYFQPTEV